ncbi:hypothetical protein M9Y10_044710 [Tritrichomonas musculus]|uniref:Uncharacterized protein n=1 Tax=Tritrichomonas musculus TaxID=1915356 RepID=A0ABR2JTE8_9EUKA
MILKALFGNNKDQASPQQQQQAPPFVFSPDNEIFQFGELVTAESLIENSTENSPLLKLILWFKEHPGTAEFVSFRNFMQENIPNFSEIKRVSIKEQILKGIDLIIRQEKVISDPTHKQHQSIERPFPNLIGIKESNLLWRKIQLNDIIIDVINQKLNLIINKSLKAYKIKASSIVSLLTSVDAFPANYIPIVNYKGLDLNNEMVINKDPEGRILQQKILALQQDSMVYYKNMNKIEDRFSVIESINPQPALFYKMIEQYLPFFNEKGKFLEGAVDTNPFLDFLNHPRCDALASFQNYISKCQEKTFSNFVESMFLIFEISQPQMRLLLVALSSYALAPIHIPMLDHNGNMNEKNIDYSFQFFIETDPLKFLNLIYEKAQEDQSEDSLGKVMQQVIEGFSGFANNWVDVFRYVVFFSIPEFLPSHLQQVRNEIEKCIQLYN